MTLKNIFRMCFIVIPLLLMDLQGHGSAVPGLSIEELATRSDLIAIAKVGNISKVGNGTVEINSQTFQAELMEASAQATLVLKGKTVTPMLKIRFALPSSPAGSLGFSGVAERSTRLFFLKASRDAFTFANPYYPSLPAPAEPSEQKLDSMQALASLSDAGKMVVAVECEAIASSSNTAPERTEAIWVLKKRSEPCINGALHRAFDSADQGLRLTAAASLLMQNDISVLAEAYDDANRLPMDSYLRLNLASAIRDGVQNANAIPYLKRILQSKDAAMRSAAASALRNIGSTACVVALANALNDRDKSTLYYAVVGLAEIEGVPEKKPSMEDFDTNPSPYLDYWRRWAKEHLTSIH